MKSGKINQWYVEKYFAASESWRPLRRIKPYATEQEAKSKIERLASMVGEHGVYRTAFLTEVPVKVKREGFDPNINHKLGIW